MKKLGVIGGMGPMATQVLYKRIIEKTDAKCDQEHIDMIILSHASIPDRTASIKAGDTKKLLKILTDDAKMLETNGVSAIAIPCNTSHYFLDDLQKSVKIPVINMVRETIEYIKNENPGIKKIGILATDGTNFTGIYKKECENFGIECVIPDPEIQTIVMSIIYDQIKAGKKGNMDDFLKIDEFLKSKGCEAGVLACTELSCFAKNHSLDGFYVDALEILCDKSILLCGGKLKEN